MTKQQAIHKRYYNDVANDLKKMYESGLARFTEVLSQNEIDQLLGAISVSDNDEPEGTYDYIDDIVKDVHWDSSIKSSKYSFEQLAKTSPEAAQEMLDNFKKITMEILNTNSTKKIAKEMSILKAEIEDLKKENTRLRKMFKDSDLFD